LLDGQHRLLAIVESGVTIESMVVMGIEESVFPTLDTGRTRSYSDVLSIYGEKNCKNLASTLRKLWYYRKQGGNPHPGKLKPSVEQLTEFLNEENGVRDSLEIAQSWYSKMRPRLMSPAVIACYHHLFSEKDASLADSFFDRLTSGLNLDQTSPIYRLREKLLMNLTSLKKFPPLHLEAMLIKAWNAERKGRKIKIIKWNPANESFPAIH
jgi:hypothetical protein